MKTFKKTYKIPASADNLELSLMVVEPESSPIGVVQLVHGMCEHKERYIPFMEFLAANGYACVIHDHRGHGESVKDSEDLGYMYKGGWKAMVDDTKVVCDWAKSEYSSIPHTLFGHSMGSLVVRCFAKRYDKSIDKLIVCGAPSANPVAGIGIGIAKISAFFHGERYRPALLQNMSLGAYNKKFESEGWPNAWLCKDEEILKAYLEDPLCQFRFTCNGFICLLKLMKDCYSAKGWKSPKASLPVYFISGSDDPCAVSEKAIGEAAEFMRKVGYANTSLKLYPGMRHEILNEVGKEEVWNDVLEMIK